MQPSTLLAVGALALGALMLSRGNRGGSAATGKGDKTPSVANTPVHNPEKARAAAERYMVEDGVPPAQAAEVSEAVAYGDATQQDTAYWRHAFENEVNNFSRRWNATYQGNFFQQSYDPYQRYAAIINLLTLPGGSEYFTYNPETGELGTQDIEVGFSWLDERTDIQTWNAFTATLPSSVTFHSSAQVLMEATTGLKTLAPMIEYLGRGAFNER